MRWLVFILPFLPALVAAESEPVYARVGSWIIGIDRSLNNGCFAFSEVPGEGAFRIGINRTDDTFYVIFGDDDWKSIEYQQSYPIELEFGNEGPWEAEAAGFSFDPPEDQTYLSVTIGYKDFPLFLKEFQEQHQLRVVHKGEQIAVFPLKDSFKAGLKLGECQERADRQRKDPFKQADPFGKFKDPFSS